MTILFYMFKCAGSVFFLTSTGTSFLSRNAPPSLPFYQIIIQIWHLRLLHLISRLGANFKEDKVYSTVWKSSLEISIVNVSVEYFPSCMVSIKSCATYAPHGQMDGWMKETCVCPWQWQSSGLYKAYYTNEKSVGNWLVPYHPVCLPWWTASGSGLLVICSENKSFSTSLYS